MRVERKKLVTGLGGRGRCGDLERPCFTCLNGGTEGDQVEWCLEWLLSSPQGMCSQESCGVHIAAKAT